MIQYPKYTIVLANRPTLPYVILENASGFPEGSVEEQVMSKMHSSHETFDEAPRTLATLSDGPVLLAASNQLIDNTFDIRG